MQDFIPYKLEYEGAKMMLRESTPAQTEIIKVSGITDATIFSKWLIIRQTIALRLSHRSLLACTLAGPEIASVV